MTPTVKGTIVLTSGPTLRLVDAGVGVTPRYLFEYQFTPDAMGVTRWLPQSGFSTEDVVEILKGVGYLT